MKILKLDHTPMSCYFTGKIMVLPNPYKVVKDFIKEKGLKLYGGQALHEHIYKKDKKGSIQNMNFPIMMYSLQMPGIMPRNWQTD